MVHLLTEDEVIAIQDAFSLFDRTGSCFVKNEEFASLVRSLGHNPTEEDLGKMLRELDPKGKGVVDYAHFLELMAKTIHKESPTDQRERLMEAFRVFDRDGSGRVSMRISKQLMMGVGKKTNENEVNDMIRHGDPDGEGYVDYERLIDIMLQE